MKYRPCLKLVATLVVGTSLLGCTTTEYVYEPGPTPDPPSAPAPPPAPVVDADATAAVQPFFRQVLAAYHAENNAYPDKLMDLQNGGFGRLPQLPPGRVFEYDSTAGTVRVIHRR